MSSLFQYLAVLVPVLVMLFVYFVRLEIRLAKICNDIAWIKKNMSLCQPS